MNFGGRNPFVPKAQVAEQKAREAGDAPTRSRLWRDAARLWERAGEREMEGKRRAEYERNAEQARTAADGDEVAGGDVEAALEKAGVLAPKGTPSGGTLPN